MTAAPGLTHALTVVLELSPREIVGITPWGYDRAGVGVVGGSFSGPRSRGVVLPGSGGDWAILRQDGVLDLDARYLLRSEDGAVIYLRSRGCARLDDPAGALRVSTRFEVATGPHDWLTRGVFVGIGNRNRTATGNTIHYYQLD